jgi:hypothetical protein
MNIKIGKKGLIKSGDYEGWHVTIQDDAENSGGYLVLIQSPDKSNPIGYDDWVENKEYLNKYIRDSNWTIDWLE